MKIYLVFVLILMILVSACGTTQLISNNPDAEIYVNGYLKGKGIAGIQRTGPPSRIKVEARLNGETIGNIDGKRHITILSILVGVYTYGIGFFFTWKYPDMIVIPVRNTENKGWSDENAKSVWDLPPGEFHK